MNPVREAAQSCIKGIRGAFLRCDRGERLYVTNAPMKSEIRIEWPGFEVYREGNLAYLMPGEVWIGIFCEWAAARTQEKRLFYSVANACFGGADEEDMRLFAEGIKQLELKGDIVEYEKKVRRRAAVCLREKSGGASLGACALIADMMNEGGYADED